MAQPDTDNGTLSITLALAYGPTWYMPDYWSESSHAYDYLGHESHPYSEMPKAVVPATLGDTLASVYDRAGDALGIAPGPDAMRFREGAKATLSLQVCHVGFYRPSDEEGFDIPRSYRWTTEVPVADMDGSVHLLSLHEVTYRQLLVSQRLGLVEGDVARPYICPSMPQGDIPALTHAAHLSVGAVKAAYSGLQGVAQEARPVEQSARGHIDDAQRLAFLAVAWS